MQKFKNIVCVLLVGILSCFVFVGCNENKTKIELPEHINLSSETSAPLLKVYDVNTKTIESMELEEYVKGVLAGEIYNDWSIEAIKAQAILARTYTLYFLKNQKSKYEGADISNDVTEAQAYDKSKINENIERAVNETQGKVIVSDGELIEAWFHSNSGGITTTAKAGLNYLGDENYTKSVASPETAENSKDFNWSVTLTKSEILSALRKMGVTVNNINSFRIGEKDESGRASTIIIGDSEVSANTLRLNIGGTKLKSTLIDDIVVSKNSVTISGKGYGHGVGLSQWGAKVLAEQGKSHTEIIDYYFKNIKITNAEYN